jgi:hypothetical protein
MRPYAAQLGNTAVPAKSNANEVYGDVLEHAAALALLCIVWGVILYAALGAALS